MNAENRKTAMPLAMSNDSARQAAATLMALWNAGETIADLPPECKPQSPEQGRQVQLEWAELAQDSIGGWKIAATSAAGQKHIGADGPIEGPYLASNIHPHDSIISMAGNRMAVAEAEFAFRMGRDLRPGQKPCSIEEILDAVASLHPSLEMPDSRFSEFSKVGTAALLADCACARDWIVGNPAPGEWRNADLSQAPTKLIINGEAAALGTGADAMGGPVAALQWVVNTLLARDITVAAGHYITTGVCGAPKPICAGDRVTVDLGALGSVSAVLMN